MIQVAALTPGQNVPSARFRVRQHLPHLARLGVEVVEHPPLVSAFAAAPNRLLGKLQAGAKLAARAPGLLAARLTGLCWLQRELLPGRETLERFLPPFVFDVDDAIWTLGRPGFAEAIARRSRLVLAGSPDIEAHFAALGVPTRLLPTVVDLDRYPAPAPRPGKPRGVIVGWTGSTSTLPHLADIEAPLAQFLRDSGAKLRVICDSPPHLPRIAPEALEWIPWSEAAEVEALSGVDLGLAPLPDSPWTRGKCGLKLLQYMALEIPVLYSPIGANTRIAGDESRRPQEVESVGLACGSEADWVQGLTTLTADPNRRAAMGRAGRARVEARYSVSALAPTLAAIFRDLAGASR